MKRIVPLIIFFLALSLELAVAQSNFTDNNFVITTYYPSPHGFYRQLNIYRSVKFQQVNKDGELPGGFPAEAGELILGADNKFYLYNGTSKQWEPLIVTTDPYQPLEGTPLVNSKHSMQQCKKQLGTVVNVGAAEGVPTAYICQFNYAVPTAWDAGSNNNCPGDWIPYNFWTTTSPRSLTIAKWDDLAAAGYKACSPPTTGGTCSGTGSCTSTSHAWSNTNPEAQNNVTYQFIEGCYMCLTNPANGPSCDSSFPGTSFVTQIGCY